MAELNRVQQRPPDRMFSRRSGELVKAGSRRGVPAHDRHLLSEPVDGRTRQEVLDYVLILHPKEHLTIPALVSAMLDSPGCDSTELECACAVRDYVSEGLLRLRRGEVWP